MLIDKIVLNKTKCSTLNLELCGVITLQLKKTFYSLLSFNNNKNIFTVENSNKDFIKANAFLRFFGSSGLRQFQLNVVTW